MTAAEIHFMLNHFPIIGVAIGICVLIYAVLKKDRKLTNAGLLLIIALAVITIPVALTGIEAAEASRKITYLDQNAIKSHQGIAYVSFRLMFALGFVSVFVFFTTWKEKEYKRLLPAIVLCLSIIVFGFLVVTGSTGGKIRHPELMKKSNVFNPEMKIPQKNPGPK